MKHAIIKSRDATEFQVRVVDIISELDSIRAGWESLQQRDLESSVFLTWDWLTRAFRDNPFRWSVVIVHAPDDPEKFAGILPLKYRTHWSQSREEFQTEIEAGGRLLFSEYTGFLCDPAYESEVLTAMAKHLSRMPWVKFSMRYVAQTRRAQIFANALSDLGFSTRDREYRINGKQTNNLLCPQVDLPVDFDTYLAQQVSANQRQKYRRLTRQYLEFGTYRITHPKPETFDAHRDILLDLWSQRWRLEKGEKSATKVAKNYRTMLDTAQAIGATFLPVLWRGDQPIGSLGHILDQKNGLVHFIVIGRDPATDDDGVGPLLHFHSINWAINNEFICYDFCHGDESYKYSYGANDTEVAYFEVRRPDYEPHLAFDPICIGEALKRTQAFLKDGKTEMAMRGCGQLSDLLS